MQLTKVEQMLLTQLVQRRDSVVAPINAQIDETIREIGIRLDVDPAKINANIVTGEIHIIEGGEMRREEGEKDMPAAKSTPARKQDEEDAKIGDGPDMRPKVQADADAPVKEQPEIDPATQESDDVGSDPQAIDEASEDGEGRDASKEDVGEDKAYGDNVEKSRRREGLGRRPEGEEGPREGLGRRERQNEEMVGHVGEGAEAMAKPASDDDTGAEPLTQVSATTETGGFSDMSGAPGSGGVEPEDNSETLSPEELNKRIAEKDAKDESGPENFPARENEDTEDMSSVDRMSAPGLRAEVNNMGA